MKVKRGIDDTWYLVFVDELEADSYDYLFPEAQRASFDGYMNAIEIDPPADAFLVTPTTTGKWLVYESCAGDATGTCYVHGVFSSKESALQMAGKLMKDRPPKPSFVIEDWVVWKPVPNIELNVRRC